MIGTLNSRAAAEFFRPDLIQCMDVAGLPDFYWYNIPKRGKMYQMKTRVPYAHKNISNIPNQNIPNDRNI
jgi:hypothetical protein